MPSLSTQRLTPWLMLAAAVVALDQLTKWLILSHYSLYDGTRITSFFNIVRAHNTGAAFSFLAGAGGWQRWFFVVLALAASAFIVWLLRSHGQQKLFAASLSLILGGAVGNAVDRLQHGYVVDFLDFHWSLLSPLFQQGHFPAFNVADIAINMGVIGWVLNEWRQIRKHS
jgi:signal peptidase II